RTVAGADAACERARRVARTWRQCRPTTSAKALPIAGGTGQSAAQHDLAGMGAAGANVSVLAGERPDDQLESEQDDQREQRRCPRTGGRVQPDRKSTRLNSS